MKKMKQILLFVVYLIFTLAFLFFVRSGNIVMIELTHNKMITFALSLSKPVMNLSNGVSVVRQAHHERFCNHFISG
jgi:hypothetical protein